MFKVILAVFALLAIANAYPSDLTQPQLVGGNIPPAGFRAVQQNQGGPQLQTGQSDLMDPVEEENKEGLEKSETFGFGYYHHYPRYYHYGYYPHYSHYYYPRYYSSYWW
ncbi:uncharacterized protein LOC131437939 [Malaya genurostris]|uniref:uncharacterized protein LOC131437939 n=1 Tax=Malaya genurostris TaxID=325434 RepID=UPI0026F3ED3D|nr:uncharacterized protein LOC131437939 [Malaya genurostris]